MATASPGASKSFSAFWRTASTAFWSIGAFSAARAAGVDRTSKLAIRSSMDAAFIALRFRRGCRDRLPSITAAAAGYTEEVIDLFGRKIPPHPRPLAPEAGGRG